MAHPRLIPSARARAQRRVDNIMGTQTATHRYGRGVEGDPQLILIHGFRGDHHGLEFVVSNLRDDFDVWAPDLPGFGTSTEFDGLHSLDAYARWLVAYVATFSRDRRTIVLGHSFGSIVVAAASELGLDVDRLILANPIAAAALSGPSKLGTAATRAYYSFGRLSPPKLADRVLRSRMITDAMSLMMTISREPVMRQTVWEEHREFFGAFSSARQVAEAFDASISHSAADFVAGLSVHKVLLLAAERDQIVPPDKVINLAQRIPNSSVVFLPEVGHLAHYERAGMMAREIERFAAAGVPDRSA